MNEFLQTVETGLKPVFTWNMIRNMQFLFYGMFLNQAKVSWKRTH